MHVHQRYWCIVLLACLSHGCASGEAHRQTWADFHTYQTEHEWQTITKAVDADILPMTVIAEKGDVKLEFSQATLTGRHDPVAPHLRFISTAPAAHIRPTIVHELYLSQLHEVPGGFTWYGSYDVRSWRLHLILMVHQDGSYTLKYAVDPL